MPSDKTGITHVYHTADPIPMGACTGAYSGCYAAGFALESRCHTGQTILYDTVTVKGWSVDVRTHRIGEVISKVLMDPWPVDGDGDGDKDRDGKKPKEDKPERGKKSEDENGDENGGGVWAEWWGWKRRGPRPGDRPDGGGDDDDDSWDKHGGVPQAKAEDDCVDCYKWSVFLIRAGGISSALTLQGVRGRLGQKGQGRGAEVRGSLTSEYQLEWAKEII
jgi:lipase ATG15